MSDKPELGSRDSAHDRQWTHRQALQIVGELPDDVQDALAVLDRARKLLLMWRDDLEPGAEPAPRASKLKLVGALE